LMGKYEIEEELKTKILYLKLKLYIYYFYSIELMKMIASTRVSNYFLEIK
jgi:hypothetical protein